MSSPTIGITILIVLVFTTLGQLLVQRADHARRHREVMERLDQIVAKLGPSPIG